MGLRGDLPADLKSFAQVTHELTHSVYLLIRKSRKEINPSM